MDLEVARIEYPSLRWHQSGWWFTALGSLLGSLVFVVPSASSFSVAGRVGTLIACIAVPGICILAWHCLKLFITWIQRGRQYPVLVGFVEAQSEELNRAAAAIDWLVKEREEKRSLRIKHCYCYQSDAVVVLAKKRGFTVSVGARMIVIDRQNGRSLGTVEVIDVQASTYTAKALDDVDPLWLGYIHQAGVVRSEPPPNTIAYLIRNQEEDNV